MSDSSSVQLYYVEETTWGEVPAGPPTLNEFRFTQDSLAQTTETAISEEIRSDRQVSDIIRTAVSAGGDVGIELSYASHDDLIAGALADNWSGNINELAVPASFTSASPGPGLFQTTSSPLVASPNWLLNVRVGQWLQIGGSLTSPTNDGYYKVNFVDAANGTIRFDQAPPSAEGAGTFTVKGQMINNGTTRKSFTLEKLFSDIVDPNASPEAVIQYFTGMRVGTMNLAIAPGAIINGSFSFEGKQAFSVGATVGDGAPSAVSANDVLNAVDNIRDILIDGVADENCQFTNIEFTVDNSLRAQPCIGQLANNGIGLGRTLVTGTIEAYLLDKSFLDRYLNFTTTSLSFRATLGGDNYIFDFPSIKFTTGTTETGGNDQDVLVSVEFSGKRDPGDDFTIAINRFAA
jgi:hypothetical protein